MLMWLLSGLFALVSPTESDVVELNVFSSRHYDADQLLYDAFEQASGIKVNVVEGKGRDLLMRIQQAGAKSPCDVFVTVDAGNLCMADEAGLFEPVQSKVLNERVPAHLRQEDGRWFALSMRARCIYYNRDAVKPDELSTYEALAEPKWKDRVLIRSSTNVYNQSLVGSIITTHGADKARVWASSLVKNFARKPQGGDTDQIRAVAAGEGDVAVANSYYYARLCKSDKPEDKEVVRKVGIFFPNQDDRGTHVNISGAGVVKGCQNREAAVRFLEFMVGDLAQEVFARGNNEFPIVKGIAADPVLQPWLENKFDTETSVETFGRRTKDALRLMDQVGWR